ncbi:MAG: 3'(2'),5'-bisphosphate nucleotidase CysQ [Acidimicrobiales bacterium]
MPSDPRPDDHALAARLATEAGRLLVVLRAQAGGTAHDLWTLRDDGDLGSHRFLMEALENARPEDKVLSEEGVENRSRLDAERVWIIDPLDGTREFAEPPRTDWAVHVALVIDGTPVAGAVALPGLELTLATEPPPRPPPHPAVDRPPRVIVSRSRPPAAALVAAEAIGGELVTMGSAGAKAMAVVRGEADVYAHAGGQYEWDSAAPVAVARAAGLHASRIDGSPLVYNRPDPWLPDLLICRPEWAEPVITALGF